jgi:hypothetical protein
VRFLSEGWPPSVTLELALELESQRRSALPAALDPTLEPGAWGEPFRLALPLSPPPLQSVSKC